MEKELDLCKTFVECMEIYTKTVNHLNESALRNAYPFNVFVLANIIFLNKSFIFNCSKRFIKIE
jgi:hypothetical protein